MTMKRFWTIAAAIFLMGRPCAAQSLPEWMISPFGFAQFWYSYDGNSAQASQEQLKVQRFRLGGFGTVAPRLSYLVNTELADGNPTAGGTVSLLDASATYAFHDLLNLRVGQDWYRFGLSSNWTLFEMPFILRSEAVDGIWLPMGRRGSFGYDRGFFVFGASKEGPLPFSYSASLTGGAGVNAADTNKQKDFVGRLTLTPLKDLSLGASLFNGFSRVNSVLNAAQQPDLHEHGFDVELLYSFADRFRAWGEYLETFHSGSDSDGIAPMKRRGFYLAAGVSPMERVELRLRYAFYDADTYSQDSIVRTWSFGTTYRIKDYSNFKLDYMIRDAQWNYAAVTGGAHLENILLAQLQLWFFNPASAKKFLPGLGG